MTARGAASRPPPLGGRRRPHRRAEEELYAAALPLAAEIMVDYYLQWFLYLLSILSSTAYFCMCVSEEECMYIDGVHYLLHVSVGPRQIGMNPKPILPGMGDSPIWNNSQGRGGRAENHGHK